jgi:hypothetical protein
MTFFGNQLGTQKRHIPRKYPLVQTPSASAKDALAA